MSSNREIRKLPAEQRSEIAEAVIETGLACRLRSDGDESVQDANDRLAYLAELANGH